MFKIFVSIIILQSCAFLHHAQVGDIKSISGYQKNSFEILVSETGFSFKEAGALFDAAAGKDSTVGKEVADTIALFQVGPRTGKPIYNESYADNINQAIYKKCPSGKATGLVMIRETNSYPIVSGEIIKIRGYCLEKIKG